MMKTVVRRFLTLLVGCFCLVPLFPDFAQGSITWTQGKDGVRVYYPSSGWTWTEGGDGRRVVYPSSGWNWTESRNGRRIIYPNSGWNWTESRDGTRIVYPSGWNWTEGRDGQRVVFPGNGWTWTEGRDGHRVVYPSSGWSYQEDQSGRRIPYRTDGGPITDLREIMVEMITQRLPLTDALRPCTAILLDQMGWATSYKTSNSVLVEAHALMNMGYPSDAREKFRYYARNGAQEEVRREAAYFTGYCSVKLGDLNQGVAEYREFLSQYENSWNTALVPDAMYVLGLLFENLKDVARAVEYYRACIARFPGSEFAQKSRERLAVCGVDARRAVPGMRQASAPVQAAQTGSGGVAQINPFSGLAWDRVQQERVSAFIRAVDRLDGVKDAYLQLTSEDRSMDSVTRTFRLWAEKSKFSDLHRNSIPAQ